MSAVIRKLDAGDFEDCSGMFKLPNRSYERQFSKVYTARISIARNRIESQARLKWGKSIEKLMSLTAKIGEKHAVVGTIYKQQKLKPSILQEVSKEYQTLPPAPRTHFVSDSDELILEDETQRVALTGNLDVHTIVTGCPICVYGAFLPNSIFHVEDYCWPEVKPVPTPPILQTNTFIVVLSGLNVSLSGLDAFGSLVSWILGRSTGKSDGKDVDICFVLIAGNSVRGCPETKPKYGTSSDYATSLDSIKKLDEALAELSEKVEVCIMPGEFDPTNHTMPQQPMHKCLFTKASQQPSFHSATNPNCFKIKGRLLLGTSGQPVRDVKRYSNLENSLDILGKTLEWGHLMPTAPDTLPCYPYEHTDPFFIENRPHIYFTANEEQFDAGFKYYKDGFKTRLICVPSFSQTRECVLVNLKDLECKVISF